MIAQCPPPSPRQNQIPADTSKKAPKIATKPPLSPLQPPTPHENQGQPQIHRLQTACQRLRKIEPPATKINGPQGKAIATKSSILDTAAIPDPPLITPFGKAILI